MTRSDDPLVAVGMVAVRTLVSARITALRMQLRLSASTARAVVAMAMRVCKGESFVSKNTVLRDIRR